jgi:outer membrane protein OmpA-like peptidoglycan-associated protein
VRRRSSFAPKSAACNTKVETLLAVARSDPAGNTGESGAHRRGRQEDRSGRHLGQGRSKLSGDRQRPAASANAAATAASAKIDAVEASTKRLVYEVVISEDQGQFKFGSAALPEAVQQRIDQMIADLKANPRGNFVEIEGHTDSSGDKMVNQRIGEARAEAVKRYLYETHQVPLHKMNVISWGEDKPVSPNNTKDGRAQNRRVVIRVLA